MLTDRFTRIHDYLRIAVTDRCNFRCAYCKPAPLEREPEEGIALLPRTDLLTFEEIASLAAVFVRLGVRKIRITGGEPLVRRGIETLFEMLSGIDGLNELALSTNGLLLEENLPMLWKHGVHQLNISLDTLRPERFLSITGVGACDAVQHAIRAAVRYRMGFESFRSIKINMVVMRGINDDELLDFVRFGEELRALAENGPQIEIRFIEFMPFPRNGWDETRCITSSEMMARIQAAYPLRRVERASPPAVGQPSLATPDDDGIRGPAKSFEVNGANFRIGFIPTVSEPFCHACSRLRCAADGTLRTCLFGQDGLNLRDMLRNGANGDTMASAIHSALQEKWFEHPPAHLLAELNTREMISIGG